MRDLNETGRFVREVAGDLREDRLDMRRFPPLEPQYPVENRVGRPKAKQVQRIEAVLLDTSRNPDGC